MFVAPLEVAYPYKRTVGTLLSRFFMSLQEGRLEGTRGSDGRVYFPPAEFDPVTGAQLDEWVTLPETGTVTTWAWQSVPQPDQPLDRPFAWAMITLDGADVDLTRLEFDLLAELAAHPNVVFTRERLLERVWGYQSGVGGKTVDVHVANLRQIGRAHV